MRPLNVHVLVLSIALTLALLACFGLFDFLSVAQIFTTIAGGFALAATGTFWYMDATLPSGERYAPFKSALADYSAFWTTIAFFLVFFTTGKPPG